MHGGLYFSFSQKSVFLKHPTMSANINIAETERGEFSNRPSATRLLAAEERTVAPPCCCNFIILHCRKKEKQKEAEKFSNRPSATQGCRGTDCGASFNILHCRNRETEKQKNRKKLAAEERTVAPPCCCCELYSIFCTAETERQRGVQWLESTFSYTRLLQSSGRCCCYDFLHCSEQQG